MAGEIIVYDPDEVYDYARFKCGDGVTYVNDLPFIIDTDETLSLEGRIADAKATGEAIGVIKSTINDLHTTGAEIYLIVEDGATPAKLEDAFNEAFGFIPQLIIEMVDTPPETMEEADQNNQIVPLNIVRSTGIVYANFGEGVKPFGVGFFQQDGFDKGWSTDIDTETEAGVYCVRVFGDFAEKKDITWENLPDKPFGEVGCDTLTIDKSALEAMGNVTDKGGIFGKVSDAIPSIDDFANGCVLFVPDLGEQMEITYEELLGTYNEVGCIFYGTFVVVPSDNFTFNYSGINTTFPQKGVYTPVVIFDELSSVNLTIPNYNGFTTLKKIDEKYLPILEKVKGKTTTIGETLTWDGSTEGKTIIEYNVPDTNGYGVTIDITYVKVSDSIPTYDEIKAGSQVYTVNGNGVGTSSGSYFVVQETDERITINHGDGLYATPTIIKTPHTDSSGLTWNETGVYFTILKISAQGQSSEDRTQSFTISGYDFIVTKPDETKIKQEYLPVDTTLTKEGVPADAKAVGDAIANISIMYEVNSAGVLYPTFGSTSWIGMQSDSLLVAQASSAILNNNELEVQ